MTATSARGTEAMKVTWEQASARRAERQFLAAPAPAGTPAAEVAFWTATLTAVPSGGSPFAPDARLTERQAEEVVAAIAAALDGTTLTLDDLSEEVVARTGPWAGDLVMPAFQDMTTDRPAGAGAGGVGRTGG